MDTIQALVNADDRETDSVLKALASITSVSNLINLYTNQND